MISYNDIILFNMISQMISYMTHASGPGCISKYLVSIFSDILESICQEI